MADPKALMVLQSYNLQPALTPASTHGFSAALGETPALPGYIVATVLFRLDIQTLTPVPF